MVVGNIRLFSPTDTNEIRISGTYTWKCTYYKKIVCTLVGKILHFACSRHQKASREEVTDRIQEISTTHTKAEIPPTTSLAKGV